MTPLCHDGRESHFSLFYEIQVFDVLSRMQLLELSEPSQPLFKATFTNLSGMIDKNINTMMPCLIFRNYRSVLMFRFYFLFCSGTKLNIVLTVGYTVGY